MSRWQRRARLIVGVFGAVFLVLLAFAFKRKPTAPPPVATRTDPRAVVESTSGETQRFNFSREAVRVQFDKLLTFEDGSSTLMGVTIRTAARTANPKDAADARTFTVTARQGHKGQNESTMALDGDVRLQASDGLTVRTEHATYADSDQTVKGDGPVTFYRGRMSGAGVGMRYEKARDMLWILDQASVTMEPDKQGAGAMTITANTATVARHEKYIQLDRDVRIEHGGQQIRTGSAIAHLSDDEQRVRSIELHDSARIETPLAASGALRDLSGHDMNLSYAADGQTLERAFVSGDANAQLAGEQEGAGRQIAASTLDVVMAPDGSTPVGLTGRDHVQLTMPAEEDVPARTIQAATLDATGTPPRGLTHAVFSGSVRYRERGPNIDRAATAASLEARLQPGLGTIEEARFTRSVRFEEGQMLASAAAARYDVNKGLLELSGAEPGLPVPHMVNDQIVVDAARIDVTLVGPIVKANGTVKSTLKPAATPGARSQESGVRSPSSQSAGGSRGGVVEGVRSQESEVRSPGATKMPAMLKQDQPVSVLADALVYDGTSSLATYTGGARLFQEETTVKGDTITLDQKQGDLAAHGNVVTTTVRESAAAPATSPGADSGAGRRGGGSDQAPGARTTARGGTPGQAPSGGARQDKPTLTRSTGKADDLKYDDSVRRLTYTGGAHLVGPEGDITAAKIELFLDASGEDVERANAYASDKEKMTLREQHRTTKGVQMVYTAATETYVVTGLPAVVVDECAREHVGKTLTFVKAADTIVIDGNQLIRTQTKGGNAQCTQ